MDRVREALFNILGSFFAGGQVLDLFAGTGSLGIEALSRGAGRVVFVEKDPRSLQVLKENLRKLSDPPRITVYPGNVFRVLPRLGRDQEKFGLILADPPFKANLWVKILKAVAQNNLLTEDGLLVAQVSRYYTLPERVDTLVRKDKRLYGETSLEFWVYQPCGVDENDHSHMPGQF